MEKVSYTTGVEPRKGKWLIVLAYSSLVLTTLMLALRVWSRLLMSNRKFQVDDWTAIAAWPFAIGVAIVAIWTMKHGFGHHVWNVSESNLELSLRFLFAGIQCYYFCMTLIRVSATFFYRRAIGNYSKAFHLCVWGNIIINVLLLLAMVPTTIFICKPVSAFWNPTLPSESCRSLANLLTYAGVFAAVFDVLTLLLPLPFILRSKMQLKQKALVCGVFVVGYSVVIFSIGRSVIMFQLGGSVDKDITWNFVSAKYWIELEVLVAFVGICLPPIFTLFKRCSRFGYISLFNDKDYMRMSYVVGMYEKSSSDQHLSKPATFSHETTHQRDPVSFEADKMGKPASQTVVVQDR